MMKGRVWYFCCRSPSLVRLLSSPCQAKVRLASRGVSFPCCCSSCLVLQFGPAATKFKSTAAEVDSAAAQLDSVPTVVESASGRQGLQAHPKSADIELTNLCSTTIARWTSFKQRGKDSDRTDQRWSGWRRHDRRIVASVFLVTVEN
jgi:hypothetical protein